MNSLMNIYPTLLRIKEGIKVESKVSFSLQKCNDVPLPFLQIRVVVPGKNAHDKNIYFQEFYHPTQEIVSSKMEIDLIGIFIDKANVYLRKSLQKNVRTEGKNPLWQKD